MPFKCGMVAHRYPDRLLDQCTFMGMLLQIRNCRGIVWSVDEQAIKGSGKTLTEYPPEQQSGEDIQLEVNLKRVMTDLVKTVGPKLTIQPVR